MVTLKTPFTWPIAGAVRVIARCPTRDEADEVVCASEPEFFQAVGQYYEDFSQTSDDEVRDLLSRAAQRT